MLIILCLFLDCHCPRLSASGGNYVIQMAPRIDEIGWLLGGLGQFVLDFDVNNRGIIGKALPISVKSWLQLVETRWLGV